MSIPKWLTKTAVEEVEKSSGVNFSDPAYEKLLGLYNEGKLNEEDALRVEQLEYLRDIMNHTVSKMSISKEAKESPATLPEKKPPQEPKVEKSIPEVPPPFSSGRPIEKSKLPPRVKEPETTKWKEIRFNKRTGTWQCVVTTRLTRNFLSENEAVEFTKKANLSQSETKVDQ